MTKKICLVLGSGGSKGLAHLGVIKALRENNFEITQIAGTSAGAMMGGLYAANLDGLKLEKEINEIDYLKLFKILLEKPTKNAILRGKKVEAFLDKLCGEKKIEDLPIKFKAVCSDLITGNKYVFSKGKLATAIRASCAIPGIFSPVKFEDKILIDGGAVNPIPVSEVEPRSGEKIIAVGLYSKIFPKNYNNISKGNILKIAFSSMQVMVKKLSILDLEKADIKILPPVEDINVLDFVKAKKYIQIGYETTMKMIPEINKLFL
ncbi:MAG TPA: patatin-like phospholipase family protein [Candidatus Woesebacteria bacterium]|nr:patatin-like phospholipase family protein [Candidatus Woesebacteria bacterium]